MYQIEYSPLNYYNNIISDECLCVGILIHNLTTGKRDFRFISNFNRFQSFDDEADPEFIKLYLQGIKEEVEENLFNNGKKFSIEEYIKIYVNSLRFAKPQILNFERNEDYADILSKMFMKFDFKKEKRLDHNKERNIIKQMLVSNNLQILSPKISGEFDEEVNLDYVTNKLVIKYFSFKEKNIKKLIPSARQWAFLAEELKDRYNVLFVYDEISSSPYSETVLKMLRKYAKVRPFSAYSNYLKQMIA